ncbi:primosomal protein N' [Patescibacteria group bacterium]
MGTKLLKIAPITKGVSRDVFYFSSKKTRIGSLVTIPLRNKKEVGIVLSIEDVKNLKSKLKTSSYSLKKISEVISFQFLKTEFINAASKTANYFLAGTGSIIKELCPQAILNKPPLDDIKAQTPSQEKNHLVKVLRASTKERVRFYRNEIRSEFAKGNSIFLCVSSQKEIEYFEDKLKKGIEDYTFSMHGKMSKKLMEEQWEKAVKETHSILIISTGLFLSLPRHDINTFILENESSPFYKAKNRPFLDTRVAVKNIAKEMGAVLILADEILRTETFSKNISGELPSATPATPRIISQSEQMLVDMTKQKTIISNELKETLESAYKNNEQAILFINRRGYELSTVCNDCQKIVKCPNCDTPITLHLGPQRKFVCHKCLFESKAAKHCPYCKGWNLKTLGIGIQKIGEEIKNLFPDFKIFRLDSDVVKTRLQGKELIKKYTETPGSILLATEMLFSFLESSVERIGVLSIDNLFNLPDFRINERIFRTLVRLKMRAKKTFIVQTRLPEHPVFKNIIKGDISGFYKSELEMRKALGYPPFKTLIKISKEGKNKKQVEKENKDLKKHLSYFNPISFEAFTPKIRGLHKYHTLIKLPANTWPEEQKELHKKLSDLPQNWKVDVDPESLL